MKPTQYQMSISDPALSRTADGELHGANGRDRVQHMPVEESLARVHYQLQAMMDNVPDRIYFKDAQGRFVQCNQAVARRLNVDSPEQVIGKSDFDFYPAAKAEEFQRDELNLIKTGKPLVNKIEQVVRPNGEVSWASVTKTPLHGPDGLIIGLVGISRDITELKQAEETLLQARNELEKRVAIRTAELSEKNVALQKEIGDRERAENALAKERLVLRTLIDNLPEGIYAKDTAGRKTLSNPADLKHLRCKTESEAIGKNDFDLYPKEIAEKFWADDLKVLQGEPVLKREEFFTDENNRKRWLLTNKLPMRSASGKIVGLVGIGSDITELKETQETLRESEDRLRQFTMQLERSNRELQDFAYVASHDLQEPLRKIVVFGERLKEKAAGKLEPETQDYLERMQKAASRMQNLINDLLTFSRVTSKAQPFSPVNLATTAKEVLEDLEGRIEMTQGRVKLGALPVIEAEPLQMRQLIQNLIGNALKFRRPEEPPVVKIAAKVIEGVLPPAAPDSPPQKLCELTVSDNGIGFDEKYLDRIFNVFQRLHSRNEYEGTGMGLAIARKIAMYHGGTITAKSATGQGAAFIVTLPVSHPKPQNNGN